MMESAEFAVKMKEHYGVEDLSLLMVDIWSAGNTVSITRWRTCRCSWSTSGLQVTQPNQIESCVREREKVKEHYDVEDLSLPMFHIQSAGNTVESCGKGFQNTTVSRTCPCSWSAGNI